MSVRSNSGPFGGAEPYLGPNPIAFAAPRKDHTPVVFDMATTVQAKQDFRCSCSQC
ncbi:Ldh family oxidoreductase [Carnobacterium maltaromaticum]|uniref:Ldh family oxidoreductase n=1 Tax=Carnobacterium maltaromaticum TaxID=2751 RepID=UPI0039BE61FB